MRAECAYGSAVIKTALFMCCIIPNCVPIRNRMDSPEEQYAHIITFGGKIMDSLWEKTATLPKFDRLRTDLKTDVLIIGGGIAGILLSLIHISEPTRH